MNERILNLLGAFGLALSDSQTDLCAKHGIHSSDIAALNTLGSAPGLTVGGLAPVIGFTRSAAVRLVDRLVAAELVARGPGPDKRQVRLTLTQKGQEIRHQFQTERSALLASAIGNLSGPEERILSDVLERSLARLTKDRESADHICRFCREEICPAASCPVECAVPKEA